MVVVPVLKTGSFSLHFFGKTITLTNRKMQTLEEFELTDLQLEEIIEFLKGFRVA